MMEAIKNYLRTYYSEERLMELLAFAQDGKLAYSSCCCLIGAATADHPLRTEIDSLQPINTSSHYMNARHNFPGAYEAEMEYYALGGPTDEWIDEPTRDRIRRRKLIPLIKAELARREGLRLQEKSQVEEEVVS